MTPSRSDATDTLRDALRTTRQLRREQAHGRVAPHDTAVFLGACPRCAQLATAVVSVTESLTQLPFRNTQELCLWIESLARRPPLLTAPNEPAESALCTCGAPRVERVVCAMRYYRMVHGASSELVVEGVRAEPGSAWKWLAFRFPLDGFETPLESCDDRSLVQAFGRGLTLADAWHTVFSALSSEELILQHVEPGLTLVCARESGSLAQGTKALVATDSNLHVVPLAPSPFLPPERSWMAWAREYAPALANKTLFASGVVHLGVLRELLINAFRRLSIRVAIDPRGALVAQRDEVSWPLDLSSLATVAVLSGWSLAQAAAQTAQETLTRLESQMAFVQAVRKARPDMTFSVNGMQLVPARDTVVSTRSLSLSTAPFALAPGSTAFAREIRFACDDVPAWSDPTYVCPCGAPSRVLLRLLPWTSIVQAAQGQSERMPAVVDRWPTDKPTAATVVTLACDVHLRIPSAAELRNFGLHGPTLLRRLRQDLANTKYRAQFDITHDEADSPALVCWGAMLGTVLSDDAQLASLHQACGAPLKAVTARAVAAGTDVVCLAAETFSPSRLDEILSHALARRQGRPSFVLSRVARLDALPVVSFEMSRESLLATTRARTPNSAVLQATTEL